MSELLKAFIQYFNKEYPNFGGKPILERYKAEFDAFDNEFIDSRYYAFQDAWQHQQAKADELQNLYTQQGINMLKLQKRVDAALARAGQACIGNEMFHQQFDDVIRILRGEQALKGEGQ